LRNASEAEVKSAILGYGLGLDLTLRDLQSKLKEKSHPWEVAKSFDGACPLSPFVAAERLSDPQNVSLLLQVNGVDRQRGNTCDMITPVLALIAHMSQFFTLQPGDVILTGTPAGVAPLLQGDVLEAQLADVLQCSASIN